MCADSFLASLHHVHILSFLYYNVQASPILDGSGSSATEPSCATIVCAEGYKCMELPEGDKCVNAECDVDCSNEPHSPLCASNGHTYDNECEFVYQRCIEEEDWSIIYPGKCKLAGSTNYACVL